MNRDEVIKRFCALSSEVTGVVYEWKHAADCFCEYAALEGYRFDEQVMQFIEDAVYKAILEAQNKGDLDDRL